MPQLERIEDLLRLVHDGLGGDPVGLDTQHTGPYEEILDLLRRRSLRLVSLGEPSADDAVVLANCGITEQFLEVFRRETGLGSLGIGQPITQTDAERTLLTSLDLSAWPYSYHFLNSGGADAVDPFTLQLVRSTASVILDGVGIIQRHVGKHIFYTVTAGWRGKIAGLYVPSRSLVIVAEAAEGTLNYANAIVDYFHRLDALLVNSMWKFETRPVSRLGLVLGFVNNLGHYFWQEMAAIDNYVKRGLHSRIEALVLGPHCFIDPLKLFSEFNGIRVYRSTEDEHLFPLVNQFADVYIRPVAATISQSLRSRVADAALSATSKRSLEQIKVAAETHFLIWINLRAHNKVWMNQVCGLAALLNRLEKRLNRPLGVVIDGWWDTKAIASKLRLAIAPTINIYDTIGVNLHTSISWANNVDFFISVIGSGLVLSSWLTGKPGIAHGNHLHQWQGTFWNIVNEGSCPASFVRSEGGCDDGSLYSNYDLDPQLLFDEACKLLQLYYGESLAD